MWSGKIRTRSAKKLLVGYFIRKLYHSQFKNRENMNIEGKLAYTVEECKSQPRRKNRKCALTNRTYESAKVAVEKYIERTYLKKK